jgi:hypothetical protein
MMPGQKESALRVSSNSMKKATAFQLTKSKEKTTPQQASKTKIQRKLSDSQQIC